MDEIPQGMSEAEEHEFWKRHALGEGVELKRAALDDPDLPPARQKSDSRRISLVLEGDTLRRLKALARTRRMGYQTLLKTFVLERLYEEEKRAER